MVGSVYFAFMKKYQPLQPPVSVQAAFELVNLLRLTNSALVELFWNTGKLLYEIRHKPARTPENDSITAIGAQLQARYGNHMNGANLNRMLQFYICYPEYQLASSLAMRYTWKEICFFMTIENEQLRNRCIQYGIEKEADLKDIRLFMESVITAGRRHRKDPFKIHAIANPRRILAREKFPNPFETGSSLLLRQLMTPAGKAPRFTITNGAWMEDKPLLPRIIEQIEHYRFSESQRMTRTLNFIFWKTGEALHNQYENLRLGQEFLLRETEQEFTDSKIAGLFTKDKLKEMLIFYRKTSTFSTALPITSLIRWEWITILNTLRNAKDMQLWALLAAGCRPSTLALKKSIAAYKSSGIIPAKYQPHINSLTNSRHVERREIIPVFRSESFQRVTECARWAQTTITNYISQTGIAV